MHNTPRRPAHQAMINILVGFLKDTLREDIDLIEQAVAAIAVAERFADLASEVPILVRSAGVGED